MIYCWSKPVSHTDSCHGRSTSSKIIAFGSVQYLRNRQPATPCGSRSADRQTACSASTSAVTFAVTAKQTTMRMSRSMRTRKIFRWKAQCRDDSSTTEASCFDVPAVICSKLKRSCSLLLCVLSPSYAPSNYEVDYYCYLSWMPCYSRCLCTNNKAIVDDCILDIAFCQSS